MTVDKCFVVGICKVALTLWIAVLPINCRLTEPEQSSYIIDVSKLEGTWVATWDNNNEITLTATGTNTFTGEYSNISNTNTFHGTIGESSITVEQKYSNGTLYGTYTFTSVSETRLTGSLLDKDGNSRSDVVWVKK